jgi:hypothetical protein
MISAIVGAKGDIATNLLLPLVEQLGPVNLADTDSSESDWEKVWKSDVVWLAIPRDQVDKVLADVHLVSSQLVIEVCSIKRRASERIKVTGATYLSLHPLHGPRIPLNGQKWVIINQATAKKSVNAKKILAFLAEKGISFLPCETEDEHDFMMGLTLSMPELLTIVIDCIVSRYAASCGRKIPSMNQLMSWAVPASNALFSAYVHAISSSAPWLRKDLLFGSFGDLVGVSLKTFEEMSKMTIVDVEEILTRQTTAVVELSQEERDRVKRWIENWFVDSTQKLFPPEK